MKKLIIGTAQLAFKYGISNKGLKTSESEMKSMLSYLNKKNFDLIDTAIDYGESEKILGKIGISNFKVITKLPKLNPSIVDIDGWVKGQVIDSICRLNINSLYGLLLHNPSDLWGPYSNKLIKALKNIKNSGLVSKIGVSIYNPIELNKIFKLLNFDIVQSPMNLIDRRLEKSGWLYRLNDKGVEIHARSIFLQGLLLMQRNEIPSKFEKWSRIWNEWELKIYNNKNNAILKCLSYPLSFPQIQNIVIGANNLLQLDEIVSASFKKIIKEDLSFMISNDEMLINPSNWKNL